MTAVHIVFYIFALIATVSATAVVTVRNPVRSVLSLVVTFFSMAGIWMLLRAEFLSLILLLVYVGAVMTLFLFIVMMLDISGETSKGGFVRYLPFGLIIVLVMTGVLMAAGPAYFSGMQLPLPADKPADYNNLKALGSILYTQYAVAFEMAGVILLAAIVAAIVLAHRGPKHRKVQVISKQLDAQPEKRVRLVKMKPEPKSPKTDGGK